MICAFEDISDLNRCLAEIRQEGSDTQRQLDDLVVVRANHYAEAHDDNDYFFYAMFLAKDKVSVIEDLRTMTELSRHFPQVPKEQVEKVWAAQSTWTGCFDVLSSLVSSHHAFIMTDCDFFFDKVFWPPLRHSFSADNSLVQSGAATPRSVVSEGGDWSLVEVISEASKLSLGSAAPEDEDSLSGWDLLSDHPHSSAHAEERSSRARVEGVSNPSILQKRTLSYRDALLTKSACSDVAALRQSFNSHSEQRPFRPAVIVVSGVVSRRRADVSYGEAVDAGDADDAEDYFDADDYFQSSEFVKGRVAATRYRAAVMLRPAIQEKKLQRIAMKGK